MPGVKLNRGADFNGNRGTNAADATQPTDLTTLQQVQGLVNARSPKDDVIVRTTTNVNLSAPGATLDGVTMSANMRFLATGQSTASQNGKPRMVISTSPAKAPSIIRSPWAKVTVSVAL